MKGQIKIKQSARVDIYYQENVINLEDLLVNSTLVENGWTLQVVLKETLSLIQELSSILTLQSSSQITQYNFHNINYIIISVFCGQQLVNCTVRMCTNTHIFM